MLHEAIRNDDLSALQHRCDIVLNGYNIVQHCNAVLR